MSALDAPMRGDGCSAERLTEKHRGELEAACAEGPGICEIYYSAMSGRPEPMANLYIYHAAVIAGTSTTLVS